jgi:hypothetical protein
MEPSFARTTFFVTGGLLVWAADFLFIYGFAALACARGFHTMSMLGIGIVPFASTVATVVAASVTAVLVVTAFRARHRRAGETRTFIAASALGAGALSLIAIVLIGLPAALLRGTCA